MCCNRRLHRDIVMHYHNKYCWNVQLLLLTLLLNIIVVITSFKMAKIFYHILLLFALFFSIPFHSILFDIFNGSTTHHRCCLMLMISGGHANFFPRRAFRSFNLPHNFIYVAFRFSSPTPVPSRSPFCSFDTHMNLYYLFACLFVRCFFI